MRDAQSHQRSSGKVRDGGSMLVRRKERKEASAELHKQEHDQNNVRFCGKVCFGHWIPPLSLVHLLVAICAHHPVQTCFLGHLCSFWPEDIGFMLLLEVSPRMRTFKIPPRVVQAAKERGQRANLTVLVERQRGRRQL